MTYPQYFKMCSRLTISQQKARHIGRYRNKGSFWHELINHKLGMMLLYRRSTSPPSLDSIMVNVRRGTQDQHRSMWILKKRKGFKGC